MKVKWELYPEKIDTGDIFAILKKDYGNGCEPSLMFLYRYRDTFNVIPYYKYTIFKTITISVSYVEDYVRKHYPGISAEEYSAKRLEVALLMVEEDFSNQVNHLIDFLS